MKKILSAICAVVLMLSVTVTASAYSETNASKVIETDAVFETANFVIDNEDCVVNYGTIKLTGDTSGMKSGAIVLYKNSVLINRGTIEGDDFSSALIDPIIPEDYGGRIVSYDDTLLINYGEISKTKMVNYSTLIFAEGSSGDSVTTYGTLILAKGSSANGVLNYGNKIDCNSDAVTLDISGGDITITRDGFYAYGYETMLSYTGNYNIVGNSETNSLVIESVADGKTVSVQSNDSLGVKDLTIGSGVMLDVNGTLTVYGTITNNGTINDNGNHDFVNQKCRFCGFERYKQGMSVSYSVAPTYTVTIPASVTLGETVEIKAENVVVEKGKQVEVKLSGDAFKLTSGENAEINYTVTKDGTAVGVSDTVLTVNPDDSSSGSVMLNFIAPSDFTYAGIYTGTVTFTVSVENE